MFNGLTIDQQIAKHKTTSGFDYLRLMLALGVMLTHSFIVCMGPAGGPYILQSPAGPFIRLILPMFFTLSGFLVAGSIFRTGSMTGFVMLRALRIFPALTVEVVISAALLGAFASTLTLGDYYTSPEFFSYFKNTYGDIHFTLPGVFEANPFKEVVNQSLWTIPSEFRCYSVLILLMLLGLIRHRWLILSLLLVACLYRFREAMLTDFSASNPGSVAPNALVLEFIAGICFYLYKDRIRLNPVLFVICLALAVALHADGSWVYLGVLPAAYVTIYLGMQTPRKPPFIFDGDYSYGVYLYAFPVQQMLVYLYPGLREWWINFMLSFPIVLACSYCSWHLIEKHALKLKQQARPTALLPAIELTLMARVKAMMPVFR